jgi:hypothetical protein
MTPNDDISETAELFSAKDFETYLKYGWTLLDVRDRRFDPRDMDDTSCPVIYVVGREKKDGPK